MEPFKRGDIVIYKWSGGSRGKEKRNGMLGIVVQPPTYLTDAELYDRVYAKWILAPPGFKDWVEDQPHWVWVENLEKIGELLDGIS